MFNKIKNSIIIGVGISLVSNFNAFANSQYDVETQVLNSSSLNEVIYLINEDGELVKLNNGMEDVVHDNLPELLSINVYEDSFVALTKDNNIISSDNLFITDKISKIEGNFFLTVDGRVSSFESKYAKFLTGLRNVKDIAELSQNVVMAYEQDGTVSIVGDGRNGINTVKGLSNVKEAIVFQNDTVLVLKNDGTIVGFGDGYDRISQKVEAIKNAKSIINQVDNLYVITFDNKAIPIVENTFKAPQEYLDDVSDIVINEFSNSESKFYKSYFITPEGGVSYYIQSDNEISDFNKQKIDHINGFDNVEKVYESGYLTIVLHKDGSITIPFNIHHELNGITGVKSIELKNQSYVVYLEDGQVITSLDNIVLNDKSFLEHRDDVSDLYNYFNVISLNTLNKDLLKEEFENKEESLVNSKESFKDFIRSFCLDRKFMLLDKSYEEIIDTLYYSILNAKPSSDEYNHMKYEIIEKLENENKSKEEIVVQITDYIFENPIFEEVFSKLTKI